MTTRNNNYIKVTAGSDDLIYLTIFENGRNVFDDEIGGSNKAFEVNGHFTIYVNHGETGSGWVIGIEVEEDAISPSQFKNAYNISLTMDENGYAPLLTVTTDDNIVVKGYHGDATAKAKDVLGRVHRLDYDLVDEVIEALQKNGLLK